MFKHDYFPAFIRIDVYVCTCVGKILSVYRRGRGVSRARIAGAIVGRFFPVPRALEMQVRYLFLG